MNDEPEPTEVDILNRFQELLGLTPIQLRLWRRLWLAKGQPVRRDELFAAVWSTSGDSYNDRHLFDSHLYLLRCSLRGCGWEVTTHTAPGRGNVRYSLHPSVSDDIEEEEIDP